MTTNNTDEARKWDKKQTCPYCDERVAKLPRHLESYHEKEVEVARAFALPKRSKERENVFALLRNRGNHNHNVQVLKEDSGYLIPVKRPTYECSPGEYLPCDDCYGYFLRYEIWRHKKQCFMRKEHGKKFGKSLQSRCATLLPVSEAATKKLKEKVMALMAPSEVSFIAQRDWLIVQLGIQYMTAVELKSENYTYVSCKMREAARLLIEMKKRDPTVQKLEDCIHPTKFRTLVLAVKKLGGFQEDTGRYETPSLPLKLGHILKKSAKILKSRGIETQDTNLKQIAVDFYD